MGTALLPSKQCVCVCTVPHTNDSSTPLRNFVLYFVETITVLVVETNHYYQCYLDTPDEGTFCCWWHSWSHVISVARNNNTSLDQLYMSFGSRMINMTEIYSSLGPWALQTAGMKLTGWMKFWQPVENGRPVWNYKQDNWKISQPFLTYGCR